jgi:TP901 family phage tail tape measure protein
LDAILRIQIKVAAREAQRQLRSVASEVRQIQNKLNSPSRGSGGALSDLQQTAAQIGKINQQLARGVAPATKWSPAIAAKQQADKVRAIKAQELNDARAAAAERRALDRAEAARNAAVARENVAIKKWNADQQKKIEAQRLAALKASQAAENFLRNGDPRADRAAVARGQASRWSPAISQTQAEKAALAQQRVLAEAWKRQTKETAAFLAGAWKNLVYEKKQANAQQATADRALVAQQKVLDAAWRKQQKETAEYLKNVWKNLVYEKKQANAQQAAADRAALAQKKILDEAWERQQKQARAVLSAAWTKQVQEAKQAKTRELQVARERLAEHKALIHQEERARREALREQKALNAQRVAEERQTAQHLNMFDRASQLLNGQSTLASRGIIAFGKDLQWVGRQLNFNFTLPMVAAGAAVFDWAMANEKAMTRLRKVYGDDPFADYSKELDQVSEGLRTLSDMFGVAQEDVIQLGAKWAAAGLTGGSLLQAVKSSLDLSILGDYEDLNAVFSDLVVIQDAFKLNSQELAAALAELNTVDNITDASLQDLVKSLARTGGAARVAGISIEELAAMTASLIPTAGTAERAGTSIKTIISRIMDPTAEMRETLALAGIELEAFMNASGSTRLDMIAATWDNLTDVQKANFASIIAGREHYNRFITLIDDRANEFGEFARVMDALAPEKLDENLQRANKEIDTLLKSDPRRIQILWTQMKNMMTEAILPLVPTIIALIAQVRNMIAWFANLDPGIQKLILGFAALIVSAGLFSQIAGSIILLLGQFARPIVFAGRAIFALAGKFNFLKGFMSKGFLGIGKAMFAGLVSPWGLAIAGMVGLAFIFRDQLGAIFRGIWEFIMKGFNLLPQSVQDVLISILNGFMKFVGWIREIFSKINPFDNSSSSSVVPQTTRSGTADTMARAAGDPGVASVVASTPAAANAAAAGATAGLSDETTAAVSATADLERQIAALNLQLAFMKPALDAQKAATEGAEAAYNAASRAADRFDESLNPLRETVESLKSQIDLANDTISDLANTPLVGMDAMADAIFENEMAQRRLRLEILKMEEAGQSYEEIERQIAAINGDIEMLGGRMEDLRQAGAGSDVLAVYENELGALRAQRDGLVLAGQNTEVLTKQLEELQRQGEIMELEKSLQFDGLNREIDQLANGLKEMTFDEIVAGIQAQQAAVADLTPAYNNANLELQAQELILKDLQAQRDALQVSYEDERARLELLETAYAGVEEQIRSMEQAIADAQAGLDFNEMGDFSTDDMQFQLDNIEMETQAMIDEWQKRIDSQFSDLDLFGPVRKEWENFKRWWNSNITPWTDRIRNTFNGLFDFGGVDTNGVRDRLSKMFDGVASFLSPIIEPIRNMLRNFWDEALPRFKDWEDNFDRIFGKVEDAWNRIKPQIEPALVGFGALLQLVIYATTGPMRILFAILQNILEFVGRVGGDVLEGLVDMMLGLVKMIVGVFSLMGNLITGDFGGAWDSFKMIFEGLWQNLSGQYRIFISLMTGLLWQIPELIWDVVRVILDPLFRVGSFLFGGIWDGMVDFWNKTIWPFFANIGSTIWNSMGAVGGWMKSIGSSLINGIWDGIVAIWNGTKGVWGFFANMGMNIWNAMKNVGGWMVNVGADMMTSLWNGFKSVWNMFADWWANNISNIPFLGAIIPDLWKFDITPTIRDANVSGTRDRSQGDFHTGGIIPGAGESNWTLLGKEMVLTQSQQARLFAIANGKVSGDAGGSGSKTVIINGDLSFPNIKSGDDAELLISNLEMIAG